MVWTDGLWLATGHSDQAQVCWVSYYFPSMENRMLKTENRKPHGCLNCANQARPSENILIPDSRVKKAAEDGKQGEQKKWIASNKKMILRLLGASQMKHKKNKWNNRMKTGPPDGSPGTLWAEPATGINVPAFVLWPTAGHAGPHWGRRCRRPRARGQGKKWVCGAGEKMGMRKKHYETGDTFAKWAICCSGKKKMSSKNKTTLIAGQQKKSEKLHWWSFVDMPLDALKRIIEFVSCWQPSPGKLLGAMLRHNPKMGSFYAQTHEESSLYIAQKQPIWKISFYVCDAEWELWGYK